MNKMEAESPQTYKLALEVTTHQLCCVQLVTSKSEACPDLGEGRSLHLFTGEQQVPRRAYGLVEIVAAMFGKYNLPTS